MRVLPKTPVWIAICTLLIAIVGCGRSDRAEVNGRVTLDGQAVENGAISFFPTGNAAGPSAWGVVKAGNYAIAAKHGPAPGANRVEVHWAHKTGRKTSYDPKMDEYREAVPKCYNRDSTLQADLKPGKNEVNFDLKSK